MASKTKIYIVLEYVTGGELFDKIVSSFTYSTAWYVGNWLIDLLRPVRGVVLFLSRQSAKETVDE